MLSKLASPCKQHRVTQDLERAARQTQMQPQHKDANAMQEMSKLLGQNTEPFHAD